MTNPLLSVMWLGTVPYRIARDLQQYIASARLENIITHDVLLLLEHPPVYTMGRNGSPDHLLQSSEHLQHLGADYFNVDRGGSITFHGPGQLIAYPILSLANSFPLPNDPQRGDIIRYIRTLETATIDMVKDLGIKASLRPPDTGVWINNNKIASIGVKLAHGITQHGLALNISTDLTWFSHIVPCGITDGGVTSLHREGKVTHTPATLAPVFANTLSSHLSLTPIYDDPLPTQFISSFLHHNIANYSHEPVLALSGTP